MNSFDILTHLRTLRKYYEACLREAQQAHGLTQFEADVLAFLYNNPQFNTANHIVEYRMLPKANVSKAIDTLLHRGWITATRDTADRRRVLLALTDSALPVVQDILAAQEHYYRQLQADFSTEETILYQEILQRVTENAKNALERN